MSAFEGNADMSDLAKCPLLTKKWTLSRSSARCSRRVAGRGGTVLTGLPLGGPFITPHVKLAPVPKPEFPPAEWQARLDLAATYRLIAHYGWADVVYNHSSMRVPGEER